jgi:hypothetical protein
MLYSLHKKYKVAAASNQVGTIQISQVSKVYGALLQEGFHFYNTSQRPFRYTFECTHEIP